MNDVWSGRIIQLNFSVIDLLQRSGLYYVSKGKGKGISASNLLQEQTTPFKPIKMDQPNPPQTEEEEEGTPANPPHRSHDARNGLKRSDPFQFGSRYLLPTDDPFEFNAWDHVETDEAYKAYAEDQYTKQRQSPVSEYDKSKYICFPPHSLHTTSPLTNFLYELYLYQERFNTDPSKWWNLFYKNNTTHFFKDRKWLHQEFPVLTALTSSDAGPATVVEIGAGAGNTLFPILSANANAQLKIHACDFSARAIDLIRSDARFQPEIVSTHVWDVSSSSSSSSPLDIQPGSVDVVLLIFIFSALAPDQWRAAVENVHRLLKPGGQVLLRDYARGDMAQVRFRNGRWLEEGFYVRGDGTRVYFFEKDEVASIWGGAFDVLNLDVDRRLLVNRLRRLKMYRCWIQGRFRKSGGDTDIDVDGERSGKLSRSRSSSGSKSQEEEVR